MQRSRSVWAHAEVESLDRNIATKRALQTDLARELSATQAALEARRQRVADEALGSPISRWHGRGRAIRLEFEKTQRALVQDKTRLVRTVAHLRGTSAPHPRLGPHDAHPAQRGYVRPGCQCAGVAGVAAPAQASGRGCRGSGQPGSPQGPTPNVIRRWPKPAPMATVVCVKRTRRVRARPARLHSSGSLRTVA